MEVVHFECGLGNQMLDYCDFLAAQKSNPQKECYAETILFEVPECSHVISAWNGFELKNIFGIELPNIKDQFSEENWQDVLNMVKKSEFWNNGWSYPEAITSAFRKNGLSLENRCKSLYHSGKIRKSFNFIKNTRIWSELLIRKADILYKPNPEGLFFESDNDVYCGHSLMFMFKDNNIQAIEKDIRKAFTFPELDDDRNKQAALDITSCNSVGIHIRRDDAMIGINRSIFYTDYYKHAVDLIKSKVAKPVFFIFGTNKTVKWAKDNLRALGLDVEKDTIKYINWNSGIDSFRDMQLLSLCKHNIISYSSFAWWGAFLNENPNKITISPLKKINTTHHI